MTFVLAFTLGFDRSLLRPPESDRVPLPQDAMSSTSRGEARWSLAGSGRIQDSIRGAETDATACALA